MIDFFNKEFHVVVPTLNDDGEEIDKALVNDSVQVLINSTLSCSITGTYDHYNFVEAINYKFKYYPNPNRKDNNNIVHYLYTIISTLILYNDIESVNVNIKDESFLFEIDDLKNLKFRLDKLLFH